ncbi:Heat shock protein 70 [Carbonactinospora thermoautotrophica]|uniref:Heat shock protein 70 n=1 Tax=Carbonactinospora thermoautotrophica TaxID=1469144 RepID=A0A132MMS9_9ACTN|nr:Hsp70 family protein [Carbonactinospora thermoautotrophica]KWW99029.1 Heat shock protein 70 [Carbonactinospora thermoautotrophica]
MSFGIDFGTSNSVVARWNGSEAEVVPVDRHGIPAEWRRPGFESLFPSVVGIRPGQERPSFGWMAKCESDYPVEAVKRMLLGDERIRLGTWDYRGTTVAAALFRQMREGAQRNLVDLSEAVITVPANATGAARYRTRAAARLAGISVKALINEPTAAAIAYAYDVPGEGRFLVFDWGGGTIDVTVLDYHDGLFEELASRGIPRLGGLEFDERLARLVARKLRSVPDPDTMSRKEKLWFRRAVELTKIALSDEERVQFFTPDGSDFTEVERIEFEEAVADLIERALEPVEECLESIGYGPDDIDAVLMIGGTSQIPKVRTEVARLLGQEPVSPLVCEPMAAVARGAAIAAAIMDGQIEDRDIAVVTHYDLGTGYWVGEGKRRFLSIIDRNSTLPAEGSRTAQPAVDGAASLKVEVWEGDATRPMDDARNFLLTRLELPIPVPGPATANRFRLTYRYDVSGILRIKAVLERTGQVIFDREINCFGEDGTPVEQDAEAELNRLLEQGGSLGQLDRERIPPQSPPSEEVQRQPGGDERQAEGDDAKPGPLVVDGSNLASAYRAVREGRKASYRQLKAAVDQLRREFPGREIFVVVDANFRYQVEDDERAAVERALQENEIIQVPAGTKGKADALVVEIAFRRSGIVVSNDSFRELQAEHPWLREEGRVLGGTLVSDEWIFKFRRPPAARPGPTDVAPAP